MIPAEELAAYLKKHHLGAEKATKNAELSERFKFSDRGSSGRHGIRNSGQLTDLLNQARSLGHPICADHRGVFYAEFREEVTATIDLNRKTADKHLRVADLCEQAAQKLPSRPS